MSFVDSLANIASNLGMSRLVPENMDKFGEARLAFKAGNAKERILKSADRVAHNKKGKYYDDAHAEAERRYDDLEPGAKRRAMRGIEREAHAQSVLNFRTSTKADDWLDTRLSGKELEEFRKKNKVSIKAAQKEKIDGRKEMRQLTKDYFSGDGDFLTGAMRVGAATTAYGAAAVGARALTGGSATTNNQGQRDIAGIPFF